MKFLVPVLVGMALALPEIAAGEDPADAGTPAEAISALIQDGDYAAAEAQAWKTLGEVEEREGVESLEASRILDLLVEARIYGGSGAEDETLELARRALRLKEKHLGPDHLELAPSLGSLGELYRQRDELERAREIFVRAVEIQEGNEERDPQQFAWALERLANLYVDLGGLAEAKTLYARELDILEEAFGHEHRSLSSVLFSYGRLLQRMSEHEDSREYYRRAKEVTEKNRGPSHPMMAWIMNGLAGVEDDLGEYARARSLYEDALALADSTLSPDHPFIASCLNNLGVSLRHLGDYEEAERIYQRSLKLYEKSYGKDHARTASTLTNLAEVHQLQGDSATAEKFFKEALATRERVLGEEHDEVATSLEHLGNLYLETGRDSLARACFERSLFITKRVFGPNFYSNAVVLAGLGVVARRAGLGDEAWKRTEEALEISRKTLGEDHPFTAQILRDRGLLLAQRGDADVAVEAALRSEAISREHVRLTAGVLPERQALGYASVRTSGLDLAITLAGTAGSSETIRLTWDALIRSRALILDTMASRHRIVEKDPELAELARRTIATRRRLANLVVRGPDPEQPGDYFEEVQGAREEKESAERTLAEKSAPFRDTIEESRIGLEWVRRQIPDGYALVSFVRYDDFGGLVNEGSEHPEPRYAAFILGNQGPQVISLGPAAEIDRLVEEWRTTVAAPVASRDEGACRGAGAQLRARIWDPVTTFLDDREAVFVVPDGALHTVNLVALPLEPTGYLIEKDPIIHYLSAERDLVSPRGPSGSGLLALGGVSFDVSDFQVSLDSAPDPGTSPSEPVFYRGRHSECDDFRKIRFEPLPGTLQETRQILDLWNSRRAAEEAVLLAGPEAREDRLKDMASGKRVLHLATHGFFLERRCAGGVTRKLRGIGGLSASRDRVAGDDPPLLLSGLALAGANHRNETGLEGEDGVLTAEEVGAMNLQGTEWVVLSACDTGRGKIAAGEGVLGLRRAFQTAGAHTLIMSLWPVEDEAAREWMSSLYRARLEENMTTMAAVHRASLEVLQTRRKDGRSTHPSTWAAFMAAGEWK